METNAVMDKERVAEILEAFGVDFHNYDVLRIVVAFLRRERFLTASENEELLMCCSGQGQTTLLTRILERKGSQCLAKILHHVKEMNISQPVQSQESQCSYSIFCDSDVKKDGGLSEFHSS